MKHFVTFQRIRLQKQQPNNINLKTDKMKNTIKITKREFIEMLKNWNHGAQPVSLQYVTEPKLTAEGKRKFGDVTKIANVGGMVGYVYENSVNNQLEREGKEREFMAQPLWKGAGKRISNALSMHVSKGSFYLTYKAQQTFRSFHFDSVLNIIPNDLIKQYFPASDIAKYQGTEKAVYHREISIDNVKRLKFKGCTYIIEGSK